jgi:glycosyltransferase involved in cell wall biosynthesis
MKFSIITVNYNNASGLEKTIKSVLSQTYTGFDFVVIDGGSTDASKTIIEQHQPSISYWVSERDSGVYNAMNKGIKAAKGEFVIFMNSGDIFYDADVLKNIEPEITDAYGIYYGNNVKKGQGTERLKTYPAKLNFSFFYSSSINHQSSFIKRKLFEEHFYYNEDYKIASDWEFFVYAICHENVPYKYINQTISIYDFTGISSDPKSSERLINEKLTSIEKYFPAFKDDYVNLSLLNSKRVKQIFHIQKHPVAWRLLKNFISLMLLFVPKYKHQD